MIKRLILFISLLAASTATHAQTSAVTVNSSGKIVVPANGTLTSPGTITGNNITSNLTATVGNLTTAGTVTAASGTSNGTWTTNALTLTSGNITDSNGAVIVADDLTATGNLTADSGFFTYDSVNNRLGIGTGNPSYMLDVYNGEARFYGNVTVESGSLTQTALGRQRLQLGSSGGGAGMIFENTGNGTILFDNYDSSGTPQFRIYQISPSTVAIMTATTSACAINGSLSIGGGTAMTKILSSSASIDFASTSAQTTNSGNTITVTGASTSNTPTVEIGLSAALPTGCSVHGIVTGSNTVTLYFVNGSASSQDPSSLTIRAKVTQF